MDADTVAAGDQVDFVLTSNVPEDLTNYLKPAEVDPPERYRSSPTTVPSTAAPIS